MAESYNTDTDSDSSNDSCAGIPDWEAARRKISISPSRRAMTEVRRALKKLGNNQLPRSGKLTEGTERGAFLFQDMFLSKDIKVSVEGMGQISVPLQKESIEQMIKLSSEGVYEKGAEMLLYRPTSVHNTRSIPARKLKVEIKDSSLAKLMEKIGSDLNVDKNAKIIPRLKNLLIYGPNQVFEKCDSKEKVKNVVGALVVILPVAHDGGECIIEYKRKQFMFFGSKHPDTIHCVSFYTNCNHNIKNETEGYRIALTYDVTLQQSDVYLADIQGHLGTAVENYFKRGKTTLAYGLNQRYSENSLKWALMKGSDRTRANALFAIAKKQGKIPCLALVDFCETYNRDNLCEKNADSSDDDLDLFDNDCDSLRDGLELCYLDIKIEFLVDENNKQSRSSIDLIGKSEFCCTKKTNKLFEPDKKAMGDVQEFHYERALVVLWSKKWLYCHGFKEALGELHQLTKQQGMEGVLIDKILEVKRDFYQPKLWVEPGIANMLIDIVIYLNNVRWAKYILGNLCERILREDMISQLVLLEKMFGDETWCDIFKIWNEDGRKKVWSEALGVYNTRILAEKYLEQYGTPIKSIVINKLLEEEVKRITKLKPARLLSYSCVYESKALHFLDLYHLSRLMKVCTVSGKPTLEKLLIAYVTSKYRAISISLGKLYIRLMDLLKPDQLPAYSEIRDVAEKSIDACLSNLKNYTDWAFPLAATCNCNVCKSVVQFFASKTLETYIIKGKKEVINHAYKIFYSFFWPYGFISYEKVGSLWVIKFKKVQQLLEDLQKFNNDLNKCKEEIQKSNSLPFVGGKVENEDEPVASTSASSNKVEITDNVKLEHEGTIGKNIQTFPSTSAEVSVNPQPKDESECKIPEKRIRRSQRILSKIISRQKSKK